MTRSTRTLSDRLTWCAAAVPALFAAQFCLHAQSVDRPSLPAPTAAFRPMTKEERLNDFLKRSVSPLSFVSSAASAGIGQWRDKPEEWGQGGAGYGRRYASSFAQHMVQEGLMYGASSALHEDNRFVPSGETGTRNRILSGIKGAFLARRDDGTRRFSYSRIGAYVGAAVISRSWQPPSSNRARGVAVSVSATIGISAGLNVAREFWPRRR